MAKQITTFIPNRPGALAGLCAAMKEGGIDMRAMNVGDAMEFGIVRIVASDPDAAARTLRDRGYVCQVEDLLAMEVEDRPGSLVELLDALGRAEVNLEYMYALFSGHEGKAGFVIRTSDQDHAAAALKEAGITILDDADI